MKPVFAALIGVLSAIALLLGRGSIFSQISRVPLIFSRLSSSNKLPVSPTSTPTPSPTLLRLPPTMPGEGAYKVPVLLYHYIEDALPQDPARGALSTPPSVLEAQLELLSANGFTPITFDELVAGMSGKIVLPAKPVILTFDDGYFDFYANAYPLLQKYHMRAVSFIPTGLIGGGNYMTWGQIEELARSPYVVFGAHSIHHPALTKLSSAALQAEIVESKRTLESHIGYVVNWFAYPYGLFNDRVVEAAKSAGFIGSATTLPGSYQYQSRLFYIPRYRAGKRVGEDFLRLVR